MTIEEQRSVLQRLKLQVDNAEHWHGSLDSALFRPGFVPHPFDFQIGDFYIRDTKYPDRPKESTSCTCTQHTDAVASDCCKVTTSTIKP